MNLFKTFLNSANKYPRNEALVIGGKTYSYAELNDFISGISYVLQKYSDKNIGIFSYRSLSAYAGILATLQSGKTYIPLNPKFPESRNKTIIDLALIRVLVVDKSCLSQMENVADSLNPETIILAPELSVEEFPYTLRENFTIFSKEEMENGSSEMVTVEADDFAYIMFTSGTTGVPKGVPVSHKNVYAYVNYLHKRYGVKPTDRFSQTFDITFDLSVHDMFLAWNGGASLYIIPENVLMAPAKFVKENKLTMWFSVPSLAQFMEKFRMLKDGIFPDLRFSLFCGEPLPKTIALAWQKAAPNSVVENIYGPTEATIGITHYRLPDEEENILEKNGIVSIGSVFKEQEYCLVNEVNELVEEEGELCLSGAQLTSGYWQNQEKTEEQFFSFKGTEKLWYKTGDLVKVEGKNIFYKSRKDFQVKVRGYRIELDEVNLAISNFTGSSLVCTVPYPIVDGVADSLYSFVDIACAKSKAEIRKYLSSVLPEYMVPKDIVFVEKFPLNSNGKIDRKKLYHTLNQK